jgi:hypothetical protein
MRDACRRGERGSQKAFFNFPLLILTRPGGALADSRFHPAEQTSQIEFHAVPKTCFSLLLFRDNMEFFQNPEGRPLKNLIFLNFQGQNRLFGDVLKLWIKILNIEDFIFKTWSNPE